MKYDQVLKTAKEYFFFFFIIFNLYWSMEIYHHGSANCNAV